MGVFVNCLLIDLGIFAPNERLRKRLGGEALPDPSLFLSGPSLGGGKWNILYWAMWGLGEAENLLGVLGGAGAFCFLLISKHNVDLGTKG